MRLCNLLHAACRGDYPSSEEEVDGRQPDNGHPGLLQENPGREKDRRPLHLSAQALNHTCMAKINHK